MSQSSGQAPSESTHTGLLITLTIIAALGGLLFGYDSAVISGATDSIKQNFVAPLGLAEERAHQPRRLDHRRRAVRAASSAARSAASLRIGSDVAADSSSPARCSSSRHWVRPGRNRGIGSSARLLTPLINCICIWFLNPFGDELPYVHFRRSASPTSSAIASSAAWASASPRCSRPCTSPRSRRLPSAARW